MSAISLDERGLITACPSCGQKNRTPFERLGETAQCGRCHTAIPPPAEPVEITHDARFHKLISASPLPVVVDYWAPWCQPCRMMAPELAKVAASGAGQFVVAKVNTDALPSLGNQYAIQSLPTLGVYRQGRELARTAGARPAAAIEAFVHQAIGG